MFTSDYNTPLTTHLALSDRQLDRPKRHSNHSDESRKIQLAVLLLDAFSDRGASLRSLSLHPAFLLSCTRKLPPEEAFH